MNTNLIAILTKAASGAIAAAILCFAVDAHASPIGYVVRADKLYKIDNASGYPRTVLSNEWGVPTSMAYKSPWVHIITGNALWRASGGDGTWILLNGEDWSGPTEMEWNAGTGKLYVVQGSRLHRMEDAANNGNYTMLGGSIWSGTTSMTSLGGWLYIIKGSTLYKVNPNDGTRSALGGAIWSGATRMTKQKFDPGDPGSLYVLINDDLYKVNPSTGARTLYGQANLWTDFTSIFCNNQGAFTSNLYATREGDEEGALVRVDNSGGSHATGIDNYSGVSVAAGTFCNY